MKTTFRKGEMLVDHDSGIRTKYRAADLLKLKTLEEKTLAECQARIAEITGDLVKIQNSIGVN